MLLPTYVQKKIGFIFFHATEKTNISIIQTKQTHLCNAYHNEKEDKEKIMESETEMRERNNINTMFVTEPEQQCCSE